MNAFIVIGILAATASAALPPDVTRVEVLAGGIRLAVNMPGGTDRASLLIVYAAPDGSTAQETLGRRPRSADERQHDIQHVLAQVRAYRGLRPDQPTALAVLEPPERSWPRWHAGGADAATRARDLIAQLRTRWAPDGQVALMAHGAGGTLIWSFIEAGPIPFWIRRIGFLDANDGFDHPKHAAPLLSWLDRDARNRLVCIAYDDRFVMQEGKPAADGDGGTQRATARMRSAIDAHRPLTKSLVGDCDRWTDAAGQVDVRVDRNYANTILHAALVGDMNGLLHALTIEGAEAGAFGRPRAYTAFIEPCEPGPTLTLPTRPRDAPTGSEFAAQAASLSAEDREAAILKAALAGNVPDFLRQMRHVTYTARDGDGNDHTVAIWVSPDYLSIGHDDDFVRVPVALETAQRIAASSGCLLPTPRICDEIWRASECRLQPRPLISARDSWTTFIAHNTIIQEQRRTVPNGPIVAGTKKDIVLSRDLPDHPDKVAVYGWHRDDGKPIQPLSLAHSARYVDYSHGVRLVWRTAEVDGKPCEIAAVLRDPKLAYLFSDEGPIRLEEHKDGAGRPDR